MKTNTRRASFMIKSVVKTPVVIDSPLPHKPRTVKYKTFNPGDIVTGDVHTDLQGKPKFVLVGKRLVIPISAISEIVTKEAMSNADGKLAEQIQQSVKKGKPTTKYIDGAIIGAVLGLLSVVFAERKKWIEIPTKENKMYGAAIGAAIFMYGVYKIRNKS